VQLSLSFEGPHSVSFPQDQPTMISYVVGQSDAIMLEKKDASIDVDEETFTEEAIQKAFTLFDLDNNGYIGIAEIKHILSMMGEIVSDKELDMMISMLDLNGDGQVSFRVRHHKRYEYTYWLRETHSPLLTPFNLVFPLKEFKAMVESPDPANDVFLEKRIHSPVQTHESPAMEQRKRIAERKHRAISRITAEMDMDFVYLTLKTVKENSSATKIPVTNYAINYQELCDLLPTVLGYSRSDCREVFDLLHNGDSPTIDSRDLIMSFTNFIPAFGLEEKCKLAFDMYDVDRSGYISMHEIEAIMMSTNTATKDIVKKRAETFMNCADTDRSGCITIDELSVAAEKLPTLLFPPHSKK
jgi:Ca2+-binding EF-hand superfamily protein